VYLGTLGEALGAEVVSQRSPWSSQRLKRVKKIFSKRWDGGLHRLLPWVRLMA
jgi:hypothetical protein